VQAVPAGVSGSPVAGLKRFRADRLPLHVLMDDGGRIALRAPSLNEEVETTIERVMREHSRRTGN